MIGEGLTPRDDELIHGRVDDMLYFFDRIYRDRNTLSLEFLRDMELEEAQEYMETVEEMTLGEAYVTLQLFHPDELIISRPVMRLGVRLGLIPKTSSLSVAAKNFDKLIGKDQWLRFQLLMGIHAQMSSAPKAKKKAKGRVAPAAKASTEAKEAAVAQAPEPKPETPKTTKASAKEIDIKSKVAKGKAETSKAAPAASKPSPSKAKVSKAKASKAKTTTKASDKKKTTKKVEKKTTAKKKTTKKTASKASRKTSSKKTTK